MIFRKNFKKIVWGYLEVKAKNKEDAQKQQDLGMEDEFDNKSSYEFEEWEEEKE